MSAIQELIVKYHENPNKEIYRSIIEKIQTESSIWAAVSKASNNYYLGNEQGRAAVYIFSDIKYGEKYVKKMKSVGVSIRIIENKNKYRMLFFSDIFRCGFDTVVVDNGQTRLHMSLFDIIKKPDESKFPKESKFIINPELMRSANWFYQENEKGRATAAVWASLFKEIYDGKYIVPANTTNLKIEALGKEYIVDKESEVSFPLIKNADGKTFYPFFTDWNEFRKYDMKEEYSSLVAGFDDLKKMASKADGVVINPFGSNIILTSELVKNVETAGKKAAGRKKEMRVGTPKEKPEEIINKLTELFNEYTEVRSASLKLSASEGEMKFIVCIDAENYSQVMQAAQQLKFEHEFPVEYISADSPLAKMAFKDAEPFFTGK